MTVPWQPLCLRLPCLEFEPVKDRIKPWADASRVFSAFFPWGRDALPSQTVRPPSHVLGLLPPHPQGCKDAYHPSHSRPPFSSSTAPTEKRSACIWPKSQGLVTHLTLPSANGLCVAHDHCGNPDLKLTVFGKGGFSGQGGYTGVSGVGLIPED